MFIDRYYLLLVVPALLFASWAQMRVSSSFGRFSKVRTYSGITGEQAARRILNANGLYDIAIRPVGGKLSDHYDPRTKVVNLSNDVFYGSTIAAVGVAAHEVGHAIQHQVGYAPIKIRMALVPVTNFGSTLSMPMILIGLLLGSQPLMNLGIVCFSLMALFQLVTLPVEFNASRRALNIIEADGILQSQEEVSGARKVLSAAALTYVAALLVSVAQLLRILILFGNRDRD